MRSYRVTQHPDSVVLQARSPHDARVIYTNEHARDLLVEALPEAAADVLRAAGAALALPPPPPITGETTRVRVVLLPWYQVKHDAGASVDRVLRVWTWIRAHLGDVPFFLGGSTPTPGYDDDVPPPDVGIGVVLTIPRCPEIRAYLDQKALSRPSAEVRRAMNRIEATQILDLPSYADDVAIVAAFEAARPDPFADGDVTRPLEAAIKAHVDREVARLLDGCPLDDLRTPGVRGPVPAADAFLAGLGILALDGG